MNLSCYKTIGRYYFNQCTGVRTCDGSGACQYVSSGEGTCAICKRCTGSSYTCQNIVAHSQDNEGTRLCSGTCKECNGAGVCANQVGGQDYFNQCPGAFGPCAADTCNGAGACSYTPAGEGACSACQRCGGTRFTCSNLAAHTQDTEGTNICTATCKECNAGACANQANGRDYFNQCAGALVCDGAGGCR